MIARDTPVITFVVIASVATNGDEGVGDGQLGSFGKHALGLLYQDPAVERGPEARPQEAGPPRGLVAAGWRSPWRLLGS